MTIQVKELIESRSLREETGGKKTGERIYRVWDDDSTAVLTAQQAESHPDLPNRNSAHPDDPKLRMSVRMETTQIQQRAYTYDIRYKYEPLPVIVAPESEIVDPTEPGFIDFNVDWSAQWMDAWRRFGDLPSDIDLPNRVDMGGWPIDSRGEPVSIENHTTVLEITEVISGVLNGGLYHSLTNRRNSARFLDAPAGMVLYKGAKSERLEVRKYRVTHTFVWDEHYHLRQAIERWEDGKPKTGWASWADADYDDVANPVFWIQPYVYTADFGALGFTL